MTRTAFTLAALLAGLTVAGCYSPYHGHYRGGYYGHSHYDRDRDGYRDYRDYRYRDGRYR
jgi:hypothetical protein